MSGREPKESGSQDANVMNGGFDDRGTGTDLEGDSFYDREEGREVGGDGDFSDAGAVHAEGYVRVDGSGGGG